jgi:ABC-type nitrate/sulfonate/bicarbonate transport system substrate-binding protein
MIHLKLALDWTPNTNHIGFLIAKELGFYERKGIQLEILNPNDDHYQTTPAKKLELKKADFAITPFESVISLNNKTNKVEAIAVFAILQEDLSSIASLKNTNINSPKSLDGKIYASYKARYEDEIVKSMIKNDQGEGNIEIIYPEKLRIWNTLISGEADATWIFDNWEGIEAKSKNILLNTFKMKDFNIPYPYSPVLVCTKESLHHHFNTFKDFIEESKNGFLYVKSNLAHAEEILKKYLPKQDLENIDVAQSILYTYPYFGDEKSCGMMESIKVNEFLLWLIKHQLESDTILNQDLFTNDLLN